MLLVLSLSLSEPLTFRSTATPSSLDSHSTALLDNTRTQAYSVVRAYGSHIVHCSPSYMRRAVYPLLLCSCTNPLVQAADPPLKSSTHRPPTPHSAHYVGQTWPYTREPCRHLRKATQKEAAAENQFIQFCFCPWRTNNRNTV